MSPGFLIASPQMFDPFFSRSVVLLCDYTSNGAMGLVINRATDLKLQTVLDDLKIARHGEFAEPVLWGGPVEPGTGFVVYRPVPGIRIHGEHTIRSDIHLSSSREILVLVAQGRGPKERFLCLGYAGWGPGQLDEEFHRGSWIWSEVDENLLFHAPFESRWERCLSAQGIAADMILMKPVDE